MQTWDRLDRHRAATMARPIAALYDDDPDRPDAFSASLPTEGGALRLDYGRTAIDRQGRALLLELAAEAGVAGRLEAMFAGAPINTTEGRAVLHSALRAADDAVILSGGQDVMPDVRATRARVAAFAKAVRSGALKGPDGPFADVVNIGIGGSDLGPAMVAEALAPLADGPRAHFLSNVDGAHASAIMARCDPRRTLVVVASKTFTTVETMTNAATLRAWIEAAGGSVADQFAAVSSAPARTADWGIDAGRVFGFADWVGGRFSLWGPIGLATEITLGPGRIAGLRAGAAAMDSHFRTAPPERNLPLLLGLIGLWHGQVCGYGSRAVIPYDQRLERLPLFLQQLEMESNGKRVDHAGQPLARDSVPVVWGAPGTNAQHAFMQAIHQGTRVVPVEFLLAARGAPGMPAHHHRLLVANCLAQAEALMRG
ncbi:MAG: glucose-6-phosphate isomerase, partial [Rhodobacteraceae bacterium]|nr:glucose-6-phosphate isomerase [Paracoccaceae bacterium]